MPNRSWRPYSKTPKTKFASLPPRRSSSFTELDQIARVCISPSPGAPGEGWGEGLNPRSRTRKPLSTRTRNPHSSTTATHHSHLQLPLRTISHRPKDPPVVLPINRHPHCREQQPRIAPDRPRQQFPEL